MCCGNGHSSPGTGIERPESLLDTSWLIEHAVSWLLRRRRGIVVPEREIDRFADSVRKLVELPRGERRSMQIFRCAPVRGHRGLTGNLGGAGSEVHHELGQRLGIGWVVDALSDRTGSTTGMCWPRRRCTTTCPTCTMR